MYIGLMSHIPDDFILWKIQADMKRHRQLHSPQIGCQVTAGLTYFAHQEPPDFSGQFFVLFRLDLLYVIRFLNPI